MISVISFASNAFVLILEFKLESFPLPFFSEIQLNCLSGGVSEVGTISKMINFSWMLYPVFLNNYIPRTPLL